MKSDVYQIITDRIIGLLEGGTAPWHRPWKGSNLAPQNFISRKPYRGINSFLLHAAGYVSPFWLTFKQVQSFGGRIKKGEHSFPVIFWKIYEDEECQEKRKIPLLRYYNVFNLAQCEGVPEVALPEATVGFEPIATCEHVVAAMPQRPSIEHGGGRACYSPVVDKVSMPETRSFESAETYYGTLFHELTHSTGHASRLNRKEVTETSRFGSDPYSREELVAEMGAAFLCGHCAIGNAIVVQSASYIQAWLARLKNDHKLVVRAAAQAQKACDFILRAQSEVGEPRDQPIVENEPPIPESSLPLLFSFDQSEAAFCSIPQVDSQPHSKDTAAKVSWPARRTLKIEEDGDAWIGKLRPKIRLKGAWLERAGFTPGNRVKVSLIEPGVLELRSAHRTARTG